MLTQQLRLRQLDWTPATLFDQPFCRCQDRSLNAISYLVKCFDPSLILNNIGMGTKTKIAKSNHIAFCDLSCMIMTTIAGGEGTTGGIIPPPTDFNNGQGTSPHLQHRPIVPIRAGSRSGILDHQQSPKILGSLTGDQLSSNLRKEVLLLPPI